MGPIYSYLREIEGFAKCKQNSKQLLTARARAIFFLARRNLRIFPSNVTIFILTSDVDSETFDVAPHTTKYAS